MQSLQIVYFFNSSNGCMNDVQWCLPSFSNAFWMVNKYFCIFCLKDGKTVVVADFGLAKLLPQDATSRSPCLSPTPFLSKTSPSASLSTSPTPVSPSRPSPKKRYESYILLLIYIVEITLDLGFLHWMVRNKQLYSEIYKAFWLAALALNRTLEENEAAISFVLFTRL